MKVIALLLLEVIRLQFARCQGGGGPSTFGYDASSACSKPYSRGARARLMNLPCDFRRQNWCTIAGSSYPWHAVRRFVQENQGLMRRMYGDERHINVLRAEFEKNDIELKYDDYYQHYADDHRRFQYDDDYEFIDNAQDDRKLNDNEYEGRSFTSRSFNDPTTKRSNKFPKLSEYTRPHFRPTEGSTTSTTTASPTTPTSSATTTTSPTTAKLSTGTTSGTMTVTTPATSTSTDNPGLKSASPTTQSTTILVNATENTVETKSSSTVDPAMVSPTVTLMEDVRDQNFSINEILSQVDRIDVDVEESVEIPRAPDVSNEEDATTLESTLTTGLPVSGASNEEDVLVTAKETTIHETFAFGDQQFRPRPEYKPSSKPETANMEGQLYQDVAAKDQQEQPVLKLRGVNACPVKEEVVAPFWANNTRGEVLALLNLYPFEQYVHWEKCTHENKQMYCRDGCRCEQQFRLHRLLAYDPNNECRGIFSDWFKFPSCCVCRCYDLPLEFRVTSRSPRTQRQRIKVQPPRSRYA